MEIIFEPFPEECFKKEKVNISTSYYDHYESTNAFWSTFQDFFDKYDTHVDSSVTRGSRIKTDVVLGPSVKEIFRSKFVFPLQVVCTNVYMSSGPKRQRQVI